MSQVIEPSVADKARAALAKHDWRGAHELLSVADARGELLPTDLELLAEASWWVGRLPAAIEVRERAYAAAMKAGDSASAGALAISLGRDNLMRSAITVATAWIRRAERLLAGLPESPEHGWLAAVKAFRAALTGDLDEGLAASERVIELGARFGDRNLEVFGLSCKGVALLARGEVDEALALMDEATVAAVGGELEPGTAGGVCCASIEACTALGDWQRAAEWTEAQDRWCAREGINGYPGMCRVYRAEMKQLRGLWPEAEAEARRASDELAGFIPAAVGLAHYTIGEIRMRRGDLPAAEEALLKAHEHGRDPEPALSRLRLAQGRIGEARASITRALDEGTTELSWGPPPNTDLARLALLPARVEIELAAGDVPAARAAADEIAALAGRYSVLAVRAQAAASMGAVLLAEGDPRGALRWLREAVRLWSELDAPFEVASARVTLARAYLADGSAERAAIELQSARASFERLGATPDLRRAETELAALREGGDVSVAGTAGQRVVRTFAFTDIVDSTRLAELLGDEAWDKLVRWHDATLRGLIAEHRGEEVKATGDGFFLAFDDPDHALRCAIDIQRRLAAQRQSQGFALSVRIGLHRAEASRVGLDYRGTGVNVAARVGGQAAGAEILASAATLAAARQTYREAGRRTVELKGVTEPVEVVSIDWR